ncbi:MAG: 2OG-Fe(II) oxygenase [Allosphingosinicella sp.]
MQLPPQIAEAYALVSAGRAGEAVLLLGRLAAQGDGPAAWQMAEWRREGQFVPRDFALARDLYRRAGEAGLIEARRRYIAMAATGAGGPRDWDEALRQLAELARVLPLAVREAALVRAMTLTAEGDPVSVPDGEVLSEAPWVTRIPGLFTADECRYLAEAAAPMFEPAMTVDERTGAHFRNPVRTSDTAVFPWVAENPAIHALNRRLAAASGTRPEQGEPLQVLRYAPGQQYRPHIDAIPGMANQRILTALVYLNDDFDGGETHFLEAGLTVRARRGDALVFRNVDAEGQPDKSAVHAGLPVKRGVKLLASRWIRAGAAEA